MTGLMELRMRIECKLDFLRSFFRQYQLHESRELISIASLKIAREISIIAGMFSDKISLPERLWRQGDRTWRRSAAHWANRLDRNRRLYCRCRSIREGRCPEIRRLVGARCCGYRWCRPLRSPSSDLRQFFFIIIIFLSFNKNKIIFLNLCLIKIYNLT